MELCIKVPSGTSTFERARIDPLLRTQWTGTMVQRIVNIGICTADAIGQYVDDYPARQGLVMFDKLTLTTGGNAVNCSIALRKLGIPCEAVVKIGDDILGDFVQKELERHGVGTRGLIRSREVHTPFTFVAAHRDGERSFIHTPGANATLTLEEIDMGIVEAADLVFLTGSMVMGCFDGAPSAELLRRAQHTGAITMLDTVYASTVPAAVWREKLDPCLAHLDYFVPSLPEARLLSGHDDVPGMAATFRQRGCRNVVIKLDADGAFCLDEGGARHTVTAYPVKNPADCTGAGDTWCAGFLAGLAQRLPLTEAVRRGHAVAAHGIQAIGASTGVPPLSEIEAFQRNASAGGEVHAA
jgi:sugar/nucleoside kinase (ribokinase family)